MNKQELMKAIKTMDTKQKNELIYTLYKHIPTTVRKSSVDPLIFANDPTIANKRNKPDDFPKLQNDVFRFCEYAKQGLYFAPNRIVPKAKRSKWRFELSGYVKKLKAYERNNDHFIETTDLLCMIYDVLQTGCRIHLFSTDDPFASIQSSSTRFYRPIVERYLQAGQLMEHLDALIDMACFADVSRWDINLELSVILLNAIDTTQQPILLENLNERLKPQNRAAIPGSSYYAIRDNKKNLAILRALVMENLDHPLSKTIGDYMDVLFTKNDPDYRRSEVTYVFLHDVIDRNEHPLKWLDAYDIFTTYGAPREDLQQEYEEVKAKLTSLGSNDDDHN